MTSLFKELACALGSGMRAATATVIETKGSTPRKAGSKMLITSEGGVTGTIGGGCAENQVFNKGRAIMEEGRAVVLDVNLSLSPDSGSEMICGGRMRILVDPWAAGHAPVASRVAEETSERRSCVLVTHADEASITRGVIGEDLAVDEALRRLGIEDLERLVKNALAGDRPYFRETQGTLLTIEPFLPALSLVIAGAGHIAQPLATFGSMLGFHVTVMDDRDIFANPGRFPKAGRIIVGPFEEALRTLPIDRRTYVVLLTRGHDYDEECLRAVITRDAAYLGMIGSRRRVRAVIDKLKAQGFAEDLFERLHAPVGLDLGAETPQEIALCIAAEIEMVMKGGTGCPLSRKFAEQKKTGPPEDVI
jgi:xanthine dehydrogenase accessory factor